MCIRDSTNAEQAKIAEDAGASAVMALERVPSDIRKDGGVARMANIGIIEKIMHEVNIPVMAKARIGHFMEARILEALGVDFIDESEVLTPADEEHHIEMCIRDRPTVAHALVRAASAFLPTPGWRRRKVETTLDPARWTARATVLNQDRVCDCRARWAR